MRLSLSLLLLFSCLYGFCQDAGTFAIPHSRIHLQLPNDKWKLSADSDSTQGSFIFKREPVKDAHDRLIIPAIMVFVEDAKRYDGDIVVFATNKQASFQKRGVEIGKIQIATDKGCPLTYRNGILYKCSYTQAGMDHILYMIYLMDKNNGIQLYLDMTKDLGEQYEAELLTTIRSVKES
jgi:hypothetical protein